MTLSGPAHLVELLDGLSDDELSAEVERRTSVDRILAELDRDERMARLLLDRIRQRCDDGSVSVRHEVDDAGEPRAVSQVDIRIGERARRAEQRLEDAEAVIQTLQRRIEFVRSQRDELGAKLNAVEEVLRG